MKIVFKPFEITRLKGNLIVLNIIIKRQLNFFDYKNLVIFLKVRYKTAADDLNKNSTLN